MPPRVRFAPSPTGPMHIGSARAALFNWLYARKSGGQFIVRIEDTDRERSKPEFEKDILDGLTWLGFNWDELYRQSERISIYAEYLKKLLAERKAYYCFCTEEELEAERQSLLAQGIAPKYSGRCRALTETEVKEKLHKGGSHVIRFKVPETKIIFKDIIRGNIKFDMALVGDMVIAKNIDQPLYNFAVVVDDALMKITHVIRGEDHLSNTPKQIVMAEALGFGLPEFAHLPIILNPDRSKMSKRFSDTALRDYINGGYLREAIINFLAFLGWHPKDDREVMTIDELLKEFDLKRVQKGGAIFNVEKLNWLNGHYLNGLESGKIIELSKSFLPNDWQLTEPIISSIKGRIRTLGELKDLVDFYFELPNYDPKLLPFKDMSFGIVTENLITARDIVSGVKDFDKDMLEKSFDIESRQNRGELLWPLRVALSGKSASPGPFEIMEALGKEETLKRLKIAIDKAQNA